MTAAIQELLSRIELLDGVQVFNENGSLKTDEIVRRMFVMSDGEKVLCQTVLDLYEGQGTVGQAFLRLDTETYNRWVAALLLARDVQIL